MEKIYYQRNKICLLIIINIFLSGCVNQRERIIKKVTKHYTYVLSPDRYKGTININPRSFLIVNQLHSYDKLIKYSIEPSFFMINDSPYKINSNNKAFTYTKFYKQNGVYVFLKLLNSKEKIIPENIFYELYRDIGMIYEYNPQQEILLINPSNYKYVVINNHQYLPVDSLLKQPESIKLLESIK